MNNFYFLCRTTIAEANGFPTGSGVAHKDAGDYVLLGSLPDNFQGQLTDIAQEGFNPYSTPDNDGLSTAQLSARMDVARANNPAGKVVQISRVQGRWLAEDEHPMLIEMRAGA